MQCIVRQSTSSSYLGIHDGYSEKPIILCMNNLSRRNDQIWINRIFAGFISCSNEFYISTDTLVERDKA